jgi:hypothetical protein
MMMASKRRRMRKLEATSTPREDERERIKRGMLQRIRMAIVDERGNVLTPRFVPGKVNGGPLLLEELYGPAGTYGQQHELAIRRVFFDRLEEVLSPGFVTMEDFLPYIDPEDLTPEGRERLAGTWIEATKEGCIHERSMAWDEVDKWERERRCARQ